MFLVVFLLTRGTDAFRFKFFKVLVLTLCVSFSSVQDIDCSPENDYKLKPSFIDMITAGSIILWHTLGQGRIKASKKSGGSTSGHPPSLPVATIGTNQKQTHSQKTKVQQMQS